jgi:Gas vesicle synthesis protein GvpL/GvpF
VAAIESAADRRTTHGVYVYGFTWSGHGGGTRQGVADTAVKTLEHGELAAIVSTVGRRTLRAKRRDLLRHSEVLQGAFADAPVLPLRFGTVLESERAVVDDLLVARYEELVALLQRVEGVGELRLRTAFVEQSVLAEIVAGDPRIAALRNATRAASAADPRRVELGEAVARSLSAKRAAAADEIVAALAAHAREVRVDEQREELEVVRASFLVERGNVPKLEKVAEALALRHRGLITFDLIGPMPPHSFVALASGGGG